MQSPHENYFNVQILFKCTAVPCFLAEFRHNRTVQSPHENYFNVQISFRFRGFTKAFKNFAKYITAFIFAKQIIYLQSPDHPVQNDI